MTETKPKRKKTAPRKSSASHKPPLYYVGIGASAGGLEALRPFVANLPAKSGMTYIVAQHMSPDHRSLMVELLARETKLKVEEAKNNLQPQPDSIYVAPSNTDVTVVKGKLHISSPTNTIGPKPSVDRFFMSLASDQEEHAVGIILSGTGSDGAHGIKAIKAAGGITIAQEPKSAKYDSMPKAAIRGGADLVLSPPEIAEQLSSIIARPVAAIVDDAEPPPSTMRGIVQQIAAHTGMDFTNYKDATLLRQIRRRMTAKQMASLEAYGEYINKNHEELMELASNFLICVTSFFRDPESFEALRAMLQSMLANKNPGDDIRIWVPGCASGEEVYSLAIMISEDLGRDLDKYRVQIFATDINNDAVQTARAGAYPEAALAGVQDGLLSKYFTVQDGIYHISKKLKDMVLFARQDLVQDPPFVRLDMVSCRNLLIYFKPELQDKVLKMFHYTLRDNGILFLGKSESVGRLSSLFAEKDRKNKLYVRRQVVTPMLGSFGRGRSLIDKEVIQKEKHVVASNATLGHERLFDLYSPASLLFTEAGEILEVYGDCSPFLAVRKGKADFNLFTLIKPPFRAEIRAFAHRVARSKESVYGAPVTLSVDGKPCAYRAAMHFVQRQNALDSDLLLLCFEQTRVADSREAVGPGSPEASERITELEQEVVLTRENLQTVIEELETANEELQSLNEEAQAANEELQASNEELETANEELQASNEELITVNDELNSKTGELSMANDDLNNILQSIYKGLIVLDRKLNITRHNQIALQFFDIHPSDMANIATVQLKCNMPGLLTEVQKVLQDGSTVEYEFHDSKDRYFQMRMTPYIRGINQAIDGVVMTIMDITDKKIAEDKLRLSASVFEHATEATIITDSDNKIISVNPSFTRITGYTAEEVIGKNPRLLSSGEQSKEFYTRMWEVLLSTGAWSGEIRNRRKNGEIYTEWLSINLLMDDDGKVMRHIGVFSDITDSKKAQETIERQANFDNLTGLPNRNLTMDRLGQLLLTSRRENNIFAVLFLDLDNFKAINDALGHFTGDEMIVQTAKRIKNAVRDVDSVGRMGGDEFVVLLQNIGGADDALAVADKILNEVRQPMVISGHTLQTAASIGITIYPVDGHSKDALLKNADNAMYEAKKQGRNAACFYTHQMQDEANRQHWIQQELAAALQDKHLQIHYQPIVDIQNTKLHGAEALTRWNHPNKGFIPPESFIPIAEQNGMIIPLSDWLLKTTLGHAAQWTDGLNLSLNFSVAQFVSGNHIRNLLKLLKKEKLAQQQRLTIEITESIKLADNDEYRSILHKLKDCGCRIAIDDFGTGYSSLGYLKRIPVDIVKIDRSFVRDIMTDEADAAMIRAIKQMADGLNLTVIAEGVETEAQLEFLKQCGCHYAQGHLFSPPIPHEEFIIGASESTGKNRSRK